MNYRLILRMCGTILRIEALLLFIPVLVSLYYGDEDHGFLLAAIIIISLVAIALLNSKPQDTRFRTRDAFAAAFLTWVLLSLGGALPFLFSGYFNGFIDCLFESVSGFTTTGATVLSNIEILPRGIQFWRIFTHWIGGMGVLVFMMAVLPSANASSVNLLRAESTGPTTEKLVPKIRETARIMYLIYSGMTLLLLGLLVLAGQPLYDAMLNAFSTAGTGGFAALNASIGGYNSVAVEMILAVFMFLFGISFSLFYYLIRRNFNRFIADEELRLYFCIVVVATLLVALNIIPQYGNLGSALRYSFFQVTTIISTTGTSTANFAIWPQFSQVILVALMIVGACAGSTGGGIKVIRFLLMGKETRNEMGRIAHPGSIRPVTVNGRKVSADIIAKTSLFFFIYGAVFFVSFAIIAAEGYDMVTSATAVIASLSNIGPGLNQVGPMGNYSAFTPFAKVVLSFCMIAGRLEFFPALMIFTPTIWKRGLIR